MLEFRDEKVVGFYNYEKDHSLVDNLIDKYPKKQAQLLKKLKAFIQVYNKRMINDRLFLTK